MVFLEWGGTGLLFIVHKVKFVAWAYEYQLEVVVFVYLRLVSDVDHQRAGSVTILAHKKKKSRYDPQLFWVNLEEQNVLIKKITTFGVKG